MLKKPFTIAIIVSVAWHLFLGTAFSVVITPADLGSKASYSKINFLGPLLLEDIGIKSNIAIRPGYVKPTSARKVDLSEKFYAKIERPKKQSSSKRLDDVAIRKTTKASSGIVSLYDKALAPFFYRELQEYQPQVFDVMGQVAGRKVVYKPEMPQPVKWPSKTAQDLDIDSFDMMFRFTVSPSGDVESVEKIYSSGYPEVDIIGIRYIKMWQFEPVSDSKPQMGMIRIKFRQK